MVVSLRIDCAELEIILCEESSAVYGLDLLLCAFIELFLLLESGGVKGAIIISDFHKGVKVKDKRLKILRALVKLPQLLVAACDVVQNTYYDVFVYRLPATCCILENLLRLVQVDHGLL